MPKPRGLGSALRIGKSATRIQREREAANRRLVAAAMPKPERYRDITDAVMQSHSLPGDRTSGREPTRKRKVWSAMPVKLSAITVVGKRSSGQRGRTRDWSASDYLLNEENPFLDCGEDIATDATTKTLTVSVADVFAFLSEDEQETALVDAITKSAKKYRTRTKEANQCESLSDISPLLLVSFEDEEGNEAQAAGFCLASHTDA